MYKENPKLKGSGVVACIPQKGKCPNDCADCFFQSGRSFLEPLEDNLPNMPSLKQVGHRIVRVNDGNDSNVDRQTVVSSVVQYPLKFYNTSIPKDLGGFDAPVVLTVNPGKNTDKDGTFLKEIPTNLMFIRVRTNTWNLSLVDRMVDYYGSREVPIVLGFMAYFAESIPEEHKGNYIFRKRVLNSYWAITTKAWEEVMSQYKYNKWVYSCGKIEGEFGSTFCRFCGNCIREYFVTLERMK